MNKTVGIVSRVYLRGKPLDNDCKRAQTTRFQYGLNDNRVFCYGLYKDMSDWDILDKCKTCGALVDNAKPPAELGGKA